MAPCTHSEQSRQKAKFQSSIFPQLASSCHTSPFRPTQKHTAGVPPPCRPASRLTQVHAEHTNGVQQPRRPASSFLEPYWHERAEVPQVWRSIKQVHIHKPDSTPRALTPHHEDEANFDSKCCLKGCGQRMGPERFHQSLD